MLRGHLQQQGTVCLEHSVFPAAQQQMFGSSDEIGRNRKLTLPGRAVDSNQQLFLARNTQVDAQSAVRQQGDKVRFGQERHGQTQLTEICKPRNQLLIFVAPRIAAAVEGVCISTQTGLVPIVQTGDTRQEILQGAGELEQNLTVAVILHGKIVVLGLPRPLLALHRFAHQRSDGAGSVVGGQRVHHRVQRRRRVVFHNRDNPIEEIICLYLNPIFEAHSNHRYNTADYRKIDPLLGTEEDFVELCAKAKAVGISVILDGVFSHTGSDSLYFNRNGRYGEHSGAYRDPDSPYREWYSFRRYPDDYESWWGFRTLPNVRETYPSYLDFICNPNTGVLAKWLSLGASGFRLDVADELPDAFLDRVYQTVKSFGEDKVVIGEVWEDASNKISYGNRRHYLLDRRS